MTALDRVLDALRAHGLEPRQHGAQWECRCPAHDDRRASFGFTQPNGKVLLKCQAGCTPEQIVAALGIELRDLFDDVERVKRRDVEFYPYADEDGEPLYRVVRTEPKGFRQERATATGWASGPGCMKGVRRVLYNLGAVLDVAAAGGTVLVCEGEKDCNRFNNDRARAGTRGIVATCNPGGAGKWRDEYIASLKGAQVIIVADRDEPGRKHAQAVAASVRPVAASVKVVQAARGKDLADHLDAGLGLADLEPLEAPAEPARGPATLADVLGVYRRHLKIEDDYPLLAVLGAYTANRLPFAAPVWLMVIGQSSGGKTESIMPLDGLPDVVVVSNLTSAGALLSGTSKKERDPDAKGGLLREIGEAGTIVLKDFTSILSLHRDARAEILAALREVYDGRYVRCVGADGGRRLEWSGKVGLIAACTPVLDQFHTVAGLMGERFVTIRMPRLTSAEVTERAIALIVNGSTARHEMTDAVRALFDTVRSPDRIEVPWGLIPALHNMARLAALGRAGVDRDGYSREVTFVAGEEGPGRIAGQLVSLLFGLEVLGCERDLALDVVRRVAVDCIPASRAAALRALLRARDALTTKDVALDLGLPTNTTRRVLEDVAAYGLAARRGGEGVADEWTATPTLWDLWRGAGWEDPC